MLSCQQLYEKSADAKCFTSFELLYRLDKVSEKDLEKKIKVKKKNQFRNAPRKRRGLDRKSSIKE